MTTAPSIAPRKRFPWRIYALALVLIAIGAFWPIAAAVMSESIAGAHGCPLDMSFAQPCIINGQDWGGALHSGLIMAWHMFVTFLIGLVAGLIWLVVLAVHINIYFSPRTSR